MDVPIGGTCRDDLTGVRDAFAANFAERGEVGASLCVVLNGEVVVDLVGGWADEARTRPWGHDTLVNVYSVGKAVVATLALQLVGDGTIALDDPVASVWPEFAAGGKAGATVRHALSHTAGVPAIREPMADSDLWDWQRMTSAVAATPAWSEPGSTVTYHTNTYGHLVGGIVEKVSGEMPGTRLARVADDLGADLWCGLPEEHHTRVADVIWAPSHAVGAIDPHSLEGDAALVALGYFNPPGYSSQGVVNTAAWRSAQVPSTNMHASASGVARFYDGLLQPDRVVPVGLLEQARTVQSSGPCPVLGEEVSFGLGFVPTSTRRPLGPNPRSFGHFGTGGALGFCDPDAGVAFGYVMNHVIPRWQSTRNRSLVDALYAALG